ncbi:ABC transporter ATP-binding protein [Weissella soli]|uniref:Sulfonate transport system ATP-binding protein n=1 Tax=Weissella soli TaxID=155866 RepID=A0A288QMI7_9LACO|nr:ATP-binding cassette domain-containing protein [Weissella soli]AOT56376.1 Iron-chelate-transporting ATPase [Weissella soli]NKY82829.1 ATP-binding cassette domain-containing protein [Weissella soli]RDL11945.1 sulfonate transport system ATP-binding protein [Weissella soli]GEN92825.1 sulfonate ABC transporter ATP-binding protein [Weissella soli]GJM47935.1 sulfonate ABC transporter ATP-binding protein [Weissella soli]
MTETKIQLQHVVKAYGDNVVLKDINFEIQAGEFISFVGQSGGGKTTLLRLIAGLEATNSGDIIIAGQQLQGQNQVARVMFQDARLLPWMTVVDNLTFGSKDAQEKQRALALLERVELGEKADAYPSSLSGGQQQRVALARALMSDPEILLLDEPLGALDALTRLKMQQLVADIVAESNLTTILITHDVREGVLLADRVVAVKDGDLGLIVAGQRHQTDRLAIDQTIDDVQNFILAESE